MNDEIIVIYQGNIISRKNESGVIHLNTAGKYLTDNIEIVVNYATTSSLYILQSANLDDLYDSTGSALVVGAPQAFTLSNGSALLTQDGKNFKVKV